jgi:Low affinity iron permease
VTLARSQLKLDELLTSLSAPNNRLARLEELSDDQLDQIEDEFRQRRR